MNYYEYINDLLIENKNKYIYTERLYKKFKKKLDNDYDKNEYRNTEYIFLLHVMTFETLLVNHKIKRIRGMNNTVLYIGLFDNNISSDELSNLNSEISEDENESVEASDQELIDDSDEESDEESEKSISSLHNSELENDSNHNDHDYVPSSSSENESESESDTCSDDEDDSELFTLISRNDVIDFVMNNLDNTYLKDLLLKYREDDNNIMHILFSESKNYEFEKLIDISSFNLLIEKNCSGVCPVDYIDKNNLKKIIKGSISTNLDLNSHINDLYYKQDILEKNNHVLYVSLNCLTILLSTSLVYIIGSM